MSAAKRVSKFVGLLFILSLFVTVQWNFAQGVIIPGRHHPHSIPIPKLTEHQVDVKITDQVARVRVDQVFYNPSNRTIEGTYYFPLPPDASISDFSMIVDGKVMTGELLEKGKARRIYEDIVRRQIDPALLEYAGHNLFSARIFPIPSKGERKIVLEYTSILKSDGGLIQFTYPLRGELGNGRVQPNSPVRRGTEHGSRGHKIRGGTNQIISIDLESKIPLKNIYSPSHEIDISREDDRHAIISFEGKRSSSTGDFTLYYSLSQSDFGMNILTTWPEDEKEGFFMLLVSPKTDFAKKEIIRKDIVFILDVSGSMEGKKIQQARDALTYSISHLNKNDRFSVITFSSGIRFFKKSLVSAAEYRDEAVRYVKRLEAKGGTNINEALTEALEMDFDRRRPASLVFITDGLPTVGERDISKILKNVKRNNPDEIKIFTFGVGYDVNTKLLDKLAETSHSVSDYIEPSEDIEEKIASFYTKISYPVLTDLSIDFGSVRVDDVYPKDLPDLFKGSQLTILGRYRKGRRVRIAITGKVNGRAKTYTYWANFRKNRDEFEFLPHLWATRKIGYLMDEIRLHGEEPELKEEVIRLSQEYGVMSPYTSYLVKEEALADQDVRVISPGIVMPASRDKGNGRVGGVRASKQTFHIDGVALAPESGVQAVQMSKKSREMKEAEAVADEAWVKHVRGSTFYLKDKFWVDNDYSDQKTINIKYGSDAYTELALTYPDFGKYLALGEKVIFKYKDRFIKISDSGKETFTKRELNRLFE
ncbi:VIT domain-containing protein [bacterium]